MKASDAIDIVVMVKGRFTYLTDEQAEFLQKQLYPYSRESAEIALDQYAEKVNRWDHPQFMAVLKRVADQRAETDAAYARKQASQRDMQARHEVEAYWSDIAQKGAIYDDDELERLRDGFIAENPHGLKDWQLANYRKLSGSGIRANKPLMDYLVSFQLRGAA